MKIAFLFLLIDNPNFPELWDEYFKNIDSNKYSIYIHPKHKNKHSWRPQNVIKNIVKTSWGCIVSAYLELFKEAFKNKSNYKFITISESCLPIKSFDKLYEESLKDNRSFIGFLDLKKYDIKDRILKHSEELNIRINTSDIFKHNARFMLNRKHVKEILSLYENKDQNLEFYRTMHVGDEFFLNSLKKNDSKNIRNFSITHDDWEYVFLKIKHINSIIKKLYKKYESNRPDKDKFLNKILELQELKKEISKSPKSIEKVTSRDLDLIRNSESFFYRKFTPKSNIDIYWKNILKIEK